MGTDYVVSQQMLPQDKGQATTRGAIDGAPSIRELRLGARDVGAGRGAPQDIVLNHLAAWFGARPESASDFNPDHRLADR